jgi:xanthine dehydrogenase YagS FAD-binding subunit
MLPFQYHKATSVDTAIAAAAAARQNSTVPTAAASQFIAGGTNMTDYMKLGVARPSRLIDLNGVSEAALRKITVADDNIRFGALVHMSEVEDHAEIRRLAPMLPDSLKLAASRQIRNMATLGGNILQRTRCEYFRDTSWPCNKRNPGSGCSALMGINRQHAVLGTSDACIATYHSDFAQALVALDAVVETRSPRGNRRIAFSDLHRLPQETPDVETNLRPDEVIVAIVVPIERWSARSGYLKIRDRQSYAFALASAAVALDLQNGRVREARIALGGVATVPWRSHEAEDSLRGRELTEERATRAAKAAFADAKPHEHNRFKIELGQETLVRALLNVKEMKVS